MYVLILAVFLSGSPALFPYSPGGEMKVFPDKASCQAMADSEHTRMAPRITKKFMLKCLTVREWDAIPAEFNETPAQFKDAPDA